VQVVEVRIADLLPPGAVAGPVSLQAFLLHLRWSGPSAEPVAQSQAGHRGVEEKRGALAEAPWDTVAEDATAAELPVSEEHRAELDRRWAVLEAHPDAGSSWPEVSRRSVQTWLKGTGEPSPQ
jgi:putative addiction module component (TIGR02574 family)